jgi:hypothetical protein
MGMRALRARRATSIGSRPVVEAPSESRMIAAGGRCLSWAPLRSSSPSAAARPSPVAVPPLGERRSMWARVSARSARGAEIERTR